MICGVPAQALHPGRVCPCMHALLCVLCLMMDPSWRCTADALWNMLEDDYNGEWLSLSLSSVYAPLPLPPPRYVSRSSPIQHARSSVTPSPLSRLPITHTVSEREMVARETVISLLGTWSCAHNSHFVAWKHSHTQTHTLIHKCT